MAEINRLFEKLKGSSNGWQAQPVPPLIHRTRTSTSATATTPQDLAQEELDLYQGPIRNDIFTSIQIAALKNQWFLLKIQNSEPFLVKLHSVVKDEDKIYFQCANGSIKSISIKYDLNTNGVSILPVPNIEDAKAKTSRKKIFYTGTNIQFDRFDSKQKIIDFVNQYKNDYIFFIQIIQGASFSYYKGTVKGYDDQGIIIKNTDGQEIQIPNHQTIIFREFNPSKKNKPKTNN